MTTGVAKVRGKFRHEMDEGEYLGKVPERRKKDRERILIGVTFHLM